jgi:TPR repeat protein
MIRTIGRLGCILFLAVPAFADRITFKDGRSVEGEVLESTRQSLKVKTADSVLQINRADVDKIQTDQAHSGAIGKNSRGVYFIVDADNRIWFGRKGEPMQDLQTGALAACKTGDYDLAMVVWKFGAAIGNAEAQYELGVMYYSGEGIPRDFQEALSWFRKAADQGVARAMTCAAMILHENRGVKPNLAEAVGFYTRAAELGDAEAQVRLGVMYDKGLGVPKDHLAARGWLQKAADQGNKRAKEILEKMP